MVPADVGPTGATRFADLHAMLAAFSATSPTVRSWSPAPWQLAAR
jgi:hypothetical protein